MVGPSAHGHSIFVQGPVSGHGFARVQERVLPLSKPGVIAGNGGDSGKALQEIEQDALADQQSAHRSSGYPSGPPRHHRFAFTA